jgi:hypothetical protein
VYDSQQVRTSDTSDQLRSHLRNFVDCVKSRQTPAADITIGATSSIMCHVGNIAYRLGREVRFDPATLGFPDDEQANALVHRSYREPWTLPNIS